MKPNTAGRAGGIIPDTGQLTTGCGLVAGTLLLTADGEMPVEYLTVGDRLITRDAGMVPVAAIRVRCGPMRAVRVRAGSLGHRRPPVDTVLLASQQVLVRDWRARALFRRDQALVPAARLVDGEFITDQGAVQLRVFDISFEAPHILYAGGLELASAAPLPACPPRPAPAEPR